MEDTGSPQRMQMHVCSERDGLIPIRLQDLASQCLGRWMEKVKAQTYSPPFTSQSHLVKLILTCKLPCGQDLVIVTLTSTGDITSVLLYTLVIPFMSPPLQACVVLHLLTVSF